MLSSIEEVIDDVDEGSDEISDDEGSSQSDDSSDLSSQQAPHGVGGGLPGMIITGDFVKWEHEDEDIHDGEVGEVIMLKQDIKSCNIIVEYMYLFMN